MKSTNLATIILTFTAAWIIASSAYVFGVFVKYPVSYLGLLRIDDVIFGSFLPVALSVVVFAPGMFLLFALISFRNDLLNRFTDRGLIALAAGTWIICLSVYLTLLIRFDNATPLIAVVGLIPGGVIGAAGAILDHRHGGLVGRAMSALWLAALCLFIAGSAPSPSFARKSWCTSVTSEGRTIAHGRVVYSASTGLFLVPINSQDTIIFVPVSKIDVLSANQCDD